MAGLRGNVAWLMAGKQPAKGTAHTVAAGPTQKTPLTGGDIDPTRQIEQLSETDSSRDIGISYASTGGLSGSPAFYVRDQGIGFWLFAALGADAVSGSVNFTHTITASSLLPYITAWMDVSDVLFESYVDCKVGTLVIGADAGSPLTATATLMGITPTRLATTPDPSNLAPIASGPVYNYNNATVTVGGGVTALVDSFELTIENNLTTQQTNAFLPLDIYEGSRQVSLTFDLIFDTLTEYNKFHYGGAAGTTISSSIYTTPADFSFSLGANNSIDLAIPNLAYTAFPVASNAGGDAIKVSVAAVAQRATPTSIMTATVHNQVSTY